jgi:hypothetical protein
MGERGRKALRWLVIALAGERAIQAVRGLFLTCSGGSDRRGR